MKKHAYIVMVFLCTTFICSASKIETAYKALSIYDYFKAKKTAYSCLNKNTSQASFVLANIYYRNDNPFHNYDSAYKYIELANSNFDPIKDLELLKKYSFQDSSMLSLRNNIHKASYNKYIASKKEISISDIETFINYYQNSLYIQKAFFKRDSIAFYTVVQEKKSNGIERFLRTYPESSFIAVAYEQLDLFRFNEYATNGNTLLIEKFIDSFPKSNYIIPAQDLLLAIALKQKNTALLYKYIKQFPSNSHIESSWKGLFSLEVNSYSNEALNDFITKYPDFPYKQSIEKEIELSNALLLLVKSGDNFGYINELGDTLIPFIYDGLEDFNDGLAVAERNGNFGYINKSGEGIINFDLEDAESFKNGRAIIKRGGLYYVINRTGTIISSAYYGISDFNEGLAIVKSGEFTYGAIDKNGKEEIPFQYQRMGEFSEGLSAAQKNNNFGYVDSKGLPTIPFMFQWAEKFSNGRARVQYNNKYGVIDKKGDFVIRPIYDRIDEEINSVYVVYKNNFYGFVDSSGCLLSELNNIQLSNNTAKDYTDGNLLRLSLGEEEKLINKNGKAISDEEFEEMYLPKNGLIKIFAEDKYGFINTKNKTVIKPIYDDASDFEDSVSIAEKKDLKLLINTKGEVLFSIKTNSLEKIGGNCYTYINEKNERVICNKKGNTIFITTKDTPELFKDRFLIWEGTNKTEIYDMKAGKFIF